MSKRSSQLKARLEQAQPRQAWPIILTGSARLVGWLGLLMPQGNSARHNIMPNILKNKLNNN